MAAISAAERDLFDFLGQISDVKPLDPVAGDDRTQLENAEEPAGEPAENHAASRAPRRVTGNKRKGTSGDETQANRHRDEEHRGYDGATHQMLAASRAILTDLVEIDHTVVVFHRAFFVATGNQKDKEERSGINVSRMTLAEWLVVASQDSAPEDMRPVPRAGSVLKLPVGSMPIRDIRTWDDFFAVGEEVLEIVGELCDRDEHSIDGEVLALVNGILVSAAPLATLLTVNGSPHATDEEKAKVREIVGILERAEELLRSLGNHALANVEHSRFPIDLADCYRVPRPWVAVPRDDTHVVSTLARAGHFYPVYDDPTTRRVRRDGKPQTYLFAG